LAGFNHPLAKVLSRATSDGFQRSLRRPPETFAFIEIHGVIENSFDSDRTPCLAVIRASALSDVFVIA
jgi:hypothetical protein